VLTIINKNISQRNLNLKSMNRQAAEIYGLFHPAQTSLGHTVAWYLPSTQSESPLASK
jgi:hypothetical protein